MEGNILEQFNRITQKTKNQHELKFLFLKNKEIFKYNEFLIFLFFNETSYKEPFKSYVDNQIQSDYNNDKLNCQYEIFSLKNFYVNHKNIVKIIQSNQNFYVKFILLLYLIKFSKNSYNYFKQLKELTLNQKFITNKKINNIHLKPYFEILYSLAISYNQVDDIKENFLKELNTRYSLKSFQKDIHILDILKISFNKDSDLAHHIKNTIFKGKYLENTKYIDFIEDKLWVYLSEKERLLLIRKKIKTYVNSYKDIKNENIIQAKMELERIRQEVVNKCHKKDIKPLIDLLKIINPKVNARLDITTQSKILYINPKIINFNIFNVCNAFDGIDCFFNFKSFFTINNNLKRIKKTNTIGIDKNGETLTDNPLKIEFYNSISGCILQSASPLLKKIQNSDAFNKENIKEYIIKNFQYTKRSKRLATAINLGFCGEISSANIILIPELENYIKLTINENGKETTILKDGKFPHQVALGSLLSEDRIVNILDKDFCSLIENIFANQDISNLRNDYAHGLIEDIENEYTDIFNIFSFLFLIQIFHHGLQIKL